MRLWAFALCVAVYRASRPFRGRSRARGLFTYDLRDYPDYRQMLDAAMKLTGRATQMALADIEQKLRESYLPDLARRYAPMWFEDIQIAVRKRPKRVMELLAIDSAVVNAVIELAANPSTVTINRSARMLNSTLRSVLGVDMRRLGVVVLQEAARVLTEVEAGEAEDVPDGGALEHANAISTGGPQARIGGQEDGDDGRADGGGQVGDAGVVADV